MPWLRSLGESLFATIFPSECRLCDAFLTNISRLPVCQECISAIRPMEGEFCTTCGEVMPEPPFRSFDVVAGVPARQDGQNARPSTEISEENVCELCRQHQPPYTSALAYGSYESGLRELIHLLKYDQVRPAAGVLGNMLAAVISQMDPRMNPPNLFAPLPILVVPVPLHKSKMRERGFNQAELIARTSLKTRSLQNKFELSTNLLRRRRITESQIGLTQNQRKENLRGAFIVTRPQDLSGRSILLVDDVFTTGTTVSECARVLRRAGAGKVWVATVARTLKKSRQVSAEFKPPVAMAV